MLNGPIEAGARAAWELRRAAATARGILVLMFDQESPAIRAALRAEAKACIEAADAAEKAIRATIKPMKFEPVNVFVGIDWKPEHKAYMKKNKKWLSGLPAYMYALAVRYHTEPDELEKIVADTLNAAYERELFGFRRRLHQEPRR